MRKEYNFSRGVRRNPYAAGLGRRAPSHAGNGVLDNDPPLTSVQIRELDRRVKDLDDRTRYLLVSAFSSRFALYYNVSEDTYGMNEPAHATLFKRRAAALAIKHLLGRGVQIARCRVDRRGRLVLSSVPVVGRKQRRVRKGAV
ncbi:MAG: hypothetical protein ACRDFW_13755 [bacterium]